ncbi:MAG: transposase [Bermanella sp.]
MKDGNQNKPRRIFTPEHKFNIVKEANAKQASISTIARKYDVNANQVFRWIREVELNQVRWVRVANGQQTLTKLPVQTPTFLPVTVSQRDPVQQVQPQSSPIVTLDFAKGHRLQLHQDNPELLKQLVAAML